MFDFLNFLCLWKYSRERRMKGQDSTLQNEIPEDDLTKVKAHMSHIDKEMPSRAGKYHLTRIITAQSMCFGIQNSS